MKEQNFMADHLFVTAANMTQAGCDLGAKILNWPTRIQGISPVIREMNIKEDIARTAFTFSGHGILINRKNTTGILVRSYLENDINKIDLIKDGIIDGSLSSFTKNTVSIGTELAISLDLTVGDEITLMSTANLQTPFGNLPLQEKERT